MDMKNMMALMGAWRTFSGNHPKFTSFLQAVKTKGIREGSVIEISMTTPEGEKMETNLKVQASDLEALQSLSGLMRK